MESKCWNRKNIECLVSHSLNLYFIYLYQNCFKIIIIVNLKISKFQHYYLWERKRRKRKKSKNKKVSSWMKSYVKRTSLYFWASLEMRDAVRRSKRKRACGCNTGRINSVSLVCQKYPQELSREPWCSNFHPARPTSRISP